MQDVPIRILEKEPNRRGDLFGRLMADLLVALGYDQPRLNVHKSGREIDLSADHRLESRRAVGECKATAEPIGGDDLNKFVGVLSAEKGDRPITGYFISLSGFKETALEQEKRRRRPKIVLLDGGQVVTQLIKGRLLITREHATELAGRLCAHQCNGLVLDAGIELLAHDRGWIWEIHYVQGKARTHFALIHSDGTPLARAVAEEVIASDRECGGELHRLVCLNPAPPAGTVVDSGRSDALAAYGQYVATECGSIQLDGLPADGEVGVRRLRLENLFVPLHVDLMVGGDKSKVERQAIGTVLDIHPRLALLAPPGGGKSTLLKRLAVAYSDPARRKEVADDLPAKDWLPLFFRCRELRELARGSFADLLAALSERDPVRHHAAAFRAHVDRALLEGRVLLLVDGLDEIADPGDRAAFVCTIRAALLAYPGTGVVVTSREAGFRHVAAHLASVCTSATLSPFDTEDIRRLTVTWHREVAGDTEKVRAEAERLAATIAGNDRIRQLAVNPLLLTTLLLVKRWVGSLPTRRAVLYDKAVEVLLMTWNVEAHEPIPQEEAMPQLCYVASAMMLGGLQKISRPRLAALLQEARDSLPTELGYVKETVGQFIHRVEDRSSLLMMSGLDVEDGRLVEFFEFRHLTFQEFLTARAMVEGWHPGRADDDTLVRVLEPHFADERWREVIPLAAVMGGKATEELIRRLTQLVNALENRIQNAKESSLRLALGNCLADEAAARPETIRGAIRALLEQRLRTESYVSQLARSRYGTELQEEAERAALESDNPNVSLANLRESIRYRSIAGPSDEDRHQLIRRFSGMLRQPEVLARVKGGLALSLIFEEDHKNPLGNGGETAQSVGVAVLPLLFAETPTEQYAAGWILYSLGTCRLWTQPSEPDVVGRLYWLWRHGAEDVRYAMVETLANQRVLVRDESRFGASIEREGLAVLLDRYNELDPFNEKSAALVLAWYQRIWPDARIKREAQQLLKDDSLHAITAVEELLVHLRTEPGKRPIEKQTSKRPRAKRS